MEIDLTINRAGHVSLGRYIVLAVEIFGGQRVGTINITDTELAIACDGVRTVQRTTDHPVRNVKASPTPHDGTGAGMTSSYRWRHASASICGVEDQQTWLQQLPTDARERARWLLGALAQLGCDDPVGWARSEIEEDIPQLARYRFLRTLWPQLIDSWCTRITNLPAARRAFEAGASHDDLTRLSRAVAYETVFGMLYHLADDDQSADELPSWALTEISPAGNATGRLLDGLYEDLLTLDPSGHEGQDLWS